MRQHRPANFLTPTTLAQPRHANKWMTFSRTAFQIRVTLVIHVVQQSHRFPHVRISAAQIREVLHRIGDCIAMFTQTLRLNPLMKNDQRVRSEGCHALRTRSLFVDPRRVAVKCKTIIGGRTLRRRLASLIGSAAFRHVSRSRPTRSRSGGRMAIVAEKSPKRHVVREILWPLPYSGSPICDFHSYKRRIFPVSASEKR